MSAAKLVILLTGLVIAGEALALQVGMHFLSERNNPWISFKNALLVHVYRDWEYLAHSANQFCLNLPLFVVNNVKLAGLLSIILLVTIQL